VIDQVLAVLAELTKTLLIPGSVPFLLLGMTLAVVLLLMDESRRARGRGLLAALAILYWILSLPIAATGLERLLSSGYGPITSASLAGEAQTVVVLGGGGVTYSTASGSMDVVSDATAFRLLEAERLYALLGQPRLVLSGGSPRSLEEASAESETMRDLLVQRGVPADRMLVETESGNTREQAILLGPLLAELQVGDFVLVTSPSHMRRALGAFADAGLHPVPSTSADAPSGAAATAVFLPSEEGLRRSQTALREVLALVYYGLRGWLSQP
jgi:uncharacterized SAM-binding protein YcdF (DUF218 family)